MKKILKKLLPSHLYEALRSSYSRLEKNFHSNRSYAQTGEDILIDFALSHLLKIADITYLDIGANHPSFYSNTYYFYKKGHKGVLVEPDPVLANILKKKRGRDVIINAGISMTSQREADFYILKHKELNTFSKEWAEEAKDSSPIEKIVKVPLIGINEIIAKNFKISPSFISLDVEGLDLEIIKAFDFAACRPLLFCIETIRNKDESKIPEITAIMARNDYFVYADTYINTIYVDRRLRDIWQKR